MWTIPTFEAALGELKEKNNRFGAADHGGYRHGERRLDQSGNLGAPAAPSVPQTDGVLVAAQDALPLGSSFPYAHCSWKCATTSRWFDSSRRSWSSRTGC